MSKFAQNYAVDLRPLHNSRGDEEMERFEPILIGFEEKIVGTGAIVDGKSVKIGQKFPPISSAWSCATTSIYRSLPKFNQKCIACVLDF